MLQIRLLWQTDTATFLIERMNDMQILEFIKELNNASDKNVFISSHIKSDKYIPYEIKVKICQNIVESSCMVDGRVKYNTPALSMLYDLAIIEQYTDIEIDYEASTQIYNNLIQNNIMTLIKESETFPSKELDAFDEILDWVLDDFEMNEGSFIGWLNNRVDNLGTLLEEIPRLSV